MRVRGIPAAAAIACCVLALPGAAGAGLIDIKILLAYAPGPTVHPGQESIEVRFHGQADETRDTYTPSGQLSSHEVATFEFHGTCGYIVDIARVRAGYVVQCDPVAGDNAFAWGTDSYTSWNTVTHEAQSCFGRANLSPHAHWLIGGTLEKPTVINALSTAPLIDAEATPALNQLIVRSNNPALGCTQLRIDSPDHPGREYGEFRVNRLMSFPGRGENHWTAAIGNGTTEVGTVTFHAGLEVDVERLSTDKPPPRGPVDSLSDVLRYYSNLWVNPLSAVPGVVKIDLAGGQLDAQWAADGVVTKYDIHARRMPAAASPVLFRIDQTLRPGLNTLKPKATPLGQAVIAGRANALTWTETVTYTPTRGSPITVRQTYKPIVPTSITSVQFTGGQAHPTIVIRGTGLAPLPPQSPVGSPTGHNGCPAVAGKTGSDYGVQLQINDVSKNWGAGFSTATNTSCIGLIPTKVTPNELDLQLGSFYTTYYPKFSLAPGDLVQIVAKGAGITVHVAYGAPVSK